MSSSTEWPLRSVLTRDVEAEPIFDEVLARSLFAIVALDGEGEDLVRRSMDGGVVPRVGALHPRPALRVSWMVPPSSDDMEAPDGAMGLISPKCSLPESALRTDRRLALLVRYWTSGEK